MESTHVEKEQIIFKKLNSLVLNYFLNLIFPGLVD